jgi:hypothetical protein
MHEISATTQYRPSGALNPQVANPERDILHTCLIFRIHRKIINTNCSKAEVLIKTNLNIKYPKQEGL